MLSDQAVSQKTISTDTKKAKIRKITNLKDKGERLNPHSKRNEPRLHSSVAIENFACAGI